MRNIAVSLLVLLCIVSLVEDVPSAYAADTAGRQAAFLDAEEADLSEERGSPGLSIEGLDLWLPHAPLPLPPYCSLSPQAGDVPILHLSRVVSVSPRSPPAR